MKAFGGSLSALEGGAAVLTNVEGSIAAEMEIYAITGVHLDLSKARYYAETNNLNGFHREMNSQLARIGGLEKYDLATQELIISAFGVSLDDYYQMRADAEEAAALAAKRETLDEFLNSNELAAEIMAIDDFNVDDIAIKEKMQQLDVGRQIEMMREKGIEETEIRRTIAAQIRANMEQESAAEKNAKMWRRTTEILVDRMGNGDWFDALTDTLVGFTFYTIPKIIEFLSDAENFVNKTIEGASAVFEFFGADPIENRVKFTSAEGDELIKLNDDLEEYQAYRRGRSLSGKDIGQHTPTQAFERMFALDAAEHEADVTNLAYGAEKGRYRGDVLEGLESGMADAGVTEGNLQFNMLLNENVETAMDFPSYESFEIKDPETMTLEELNKGPQYFESKRQQIASVSQEQIKIDFPTVQAGIETAFEEYESLPEPMQEIAQTAADQEVQDMAAGVMPLTNLLINEGGMIGHLGESSFGIYDETAGIAPQGGVVQPVKGDVISFPGQEPIRLPEGSLNLSTLGGIAANVSNQPSLSVANKTMLTAALENLLKENNLVVEGSSVGQIS